ncbi:Phosphonate ABC transporter phosphate-binding periplasmic component [Rhodovulum sp. P5]|uniref:phosphate/phosphite/phosphonate ABC transporter substrate-binding protein n=1 Tax=Rhodovulum sp. P5 TaxID=1564506 RepID=UPI0009C1CDDD|nr:phosphate/phosphite/phosphonate ABC transporter substrate-binding protein [Rhodovulum sp. P5]ARE40694.1 Phosphonate ABC transporter phosphate-binding periplasmic component [Rhodovulum sp. P5]
MHVVTSRGLAIVLSSLLAMALSLAPIATPRAAADPAYTIGVVPQFEARRLAEIWMPILDEISKRTGYAFQMVGASDIPQFEGEFMQGTYDFAYMNPYHALVAEDTQGYLPIIRDGGRQLFGILVVRKDAPFQSVSELAGKSIAYPAPNALGASLLIRADLDRIFALDYTASYVATHSSAYLNVFLGGADAAGGVMATFRKQDPAIGDQLRVLYETTRVPPHPIVVHPRVPHEAAEAFRKAVLDLAETDEGAALLAQVPFRKAIAAGATDYAVLRDLALESYFVPPDTGTD